MTVNKIYRGRTNLLRSEVHACITSTHWKGSYVVDKLGSLLRQCGDAKALLQGRQLHEHIVKTGLQTDRFLSNLLVLMYGKCGALSDARTVFDNINHKNSFSWNIMIRAYIQQGQVEEALVVFKQMPEKNVVSWTSMLAAYVKQGHSKKAMQMFREMPQHNVVSWTAMIAAYAQEGQLEEAKELFNLMPERNVVSWNAIVSAYGQQGQLKEALQFFAIMPERDVASWNSIIAAHAQQGYGTDAIYFYQQMLLDNLAPNRLTFSSVLSACSHDGLVNEGCHYFVSISGDHLIMPELEHYSCIIDLLGRTGWLDCSESWINHMAVRANVACWKALLSSCRSHTAVEQGEHVADHILKLFPDNAAPYVLLSNMYAEVYSD